MSSPNSSLPNLDMNRGANNASPAQGGQTNGNGNGSTNYVSPLPTGHQQDLNYLYGQIQELSAILAANRERTTQLTKVAKEVQVRACHKYELIVADYMQRRGLVPDMDNLKLGEENGDNAETDSKNTPLPNAAILTPAQNRTSNNSKVAFSDSSKKPKRKTLSSTPTSTSRKRTPPSWPTTKTLWAP